MARLKADLKNYEVPGLGEVIDLTQTTMYIKRGGHYYPCHEVAVTDFRSDEEMAEIMSRYPSERCQTIVVRNADVGFNEGCDR